MTNLAAVALGALGGASKSPAKVKAAKRNGKLGGRPTLPAKRTKKPSR